MCAYTGTTEAFANPKCRGSKSVRESRRKEYLLTVARVTEMSAISDQSFEDAVNMAVKRATSTLRNVESAWVKDQNVVIENNNITGYKVNLAITFVLEEGEQPA
jgi:flavin-binding protein dodecin